MCNKLLLQILVGLNNIYLLSLTAFIIFVGQEFRSVLAGWFWLRLSQEVESVVTGGSSHMRALLRPEGACPGWCTSKAGKLVLAACHVGLSKKLLE